jgi:hypothetical protein
MGDTKDKKIVIHEISSGGESGQALIDCYYIRHGNI